MERRHSSEPDALADEVHNDKGVVTVLFRGKKGTLKEVVSPSNERMASSNVSVFVAGVSRDRTCSELQTTALLGR